MSMRILSITLLLLSVCLCFQFSEGNSRYAGKRLSCCTRVSTANISNEVIGNTYSAQSARYRCVEAIIFATQSGTVCVDPKTQWVQNLTASMTKL